MPNHPGPGAKTEALARDKSVFLSLHGNNIILEAMGRSRCQDGGKRKVSVTTWYRESWRVGEKT